MAFSIKDYLSSDSRKPIQNFSSAQSSSVDSSNFSQFKLKISISGNDTASDDAVRVKLKAKEIAKADIYTKPVPKGASNSPTPVASDTAPAAPVDATDIAKDLSELKITGKFGDGKFVTSDGVEGTYEVKDNLITAKAKGVTFVLDSTTGQSVAYDDATKQAYNFDIKFSGNEFEISNISKAQQTPVVDPKGLVANDGKSPVYQGTYGDGAFQINGLKGNYTKSGDGYTFSLEDGTTGYLDSNSHATAFTKGNQKFEFDVAIDGKGGFSISNLNQIA